jgi:tetratricopeptide (TPR) repeat protein
LKYRSLALVAPTILIVLALQTFQRASIWGNEERLAYSWANTQLYSQRAQRYAALMAEKNGKPNLALAIIHDARERMPNNVMFALHELTLYCRYMQVTRAHYDAFIELIEKPYKFRTFEVWHDFVKFAPEAQCKGLDYDDTLKILTKLKENPLIVNNRPRKQRILHLIGLLEANSGNRIKAYQAFEEAQRIKPDIERALLQSSILASREYYTEALALLEHSERIYSHYGKSDWLDQHGKLDYQMEIDTLKSQIKKDLQKQANSQQ